MLTHLHHIFPHTHLQDYHPNGSKSNFKQQHWSLFFYIFVYLK